MNLRFDHDEHQFIASGALLARRGLLPYRDYPYFHTPYLAVIYAALFGLSGHLLLAARAFSVACGTATLGLFYSTARHLGKEAGLSTARAEMTGVVTALLLMTSPLFLIADGLAWNHDAAELLTVLAALLFLREISRGNRPLPLFFIGLLLGLAVGVRLTVAPTALVFIGFIFADKSVSNQNRRRAACAFAAGLVIALLPLALLFAIAPRQFLFGNFGYAALNTAWRQAGSDRRDTSPIGKILVFATVWFAKPANVVFVIAGALCVVTRIRSLWAGHPYRRHLQFLGLMMLYLLVGSFAPSPSFSVYFYAPLPFLILWLVYWITPQLNEICARSTPRRDLVLTRGMLLVCIIMGLPAYFDIIDMFQPAHWIPVQAHRLGEQLRDATAGKDSPVLTLSPVFALEGDLDIYECYATGVFAMRVADLVPEGDEEILHLVDESDLDALLRRRPPRAILCGIEGDIERPLWRAASDRRTCPSLTLPRHWESRDSTGRIRPFTRGAPDLHEHSGQK